VTDEYYSEAISQVSSQVCRSLTRVALLCKQGVVGSSPIASTGLVLFSGRILGDRRTLPVTFRRSGGEEAARTSRASAIAASRACVACW
jgi:hypothetical protein